MVGHRDGAVGSRNGEPTARLSRVEISSSFWHTETPIMPCGTTVTPG